MVQNQPTMEAVSKDRTVNLNVKRILAKTPEDQLYDVPYRKFALASGKPQSLPPQCLACTGWWTEIATTVNAVVMKKAGQRNVETHLP